MQGRRALFTRRPCRPYIPYGADTGPMLHTAPSCGAHRLDARATLGSGARGGPWPPWAVLLQFLRLQEAALITENRVRAEWQPLARLRPVAMSVQQL